MLLNAELKQRLNYELSLLEYARKEYSRRLDSLQEYRGARLRKTRPGNKKSYYYIKRHSSDKYHYLGLSGQLEVERAREVRFLEEAIQRIDRNIDLMKSLADGFLPFDPSSVSASLPEIYRCEVPPVSKLYEIEGAKWRDRRLEFQKGFPENYPQNKKHTASDGVKVKTISELTLYERLRGAGLAVIYELPFPPKDYGPALYPDCTVLSPIDMKTEIIIEYVGRLDLQEYREDFARRVRRYIASGYIPGVNLFFVFGGKDGEVDSTQISKVIADIFLSQIRFRVQQIWERRGESVGKGDF